MGFESVFNYSGTNQRRTRNFAPEMPARELEKIEQTLQGLSMINAGLGGAHEKSIPSGYASGDEDDADYIKDELNETFHRSHKAELDLDKRLAKQKEIDEARIAIVYEALSKGVELADNPLYYDMLENYPYF